MSDISMKEALKASVERENQLKESRERDRLARFDHARKSVPALVIADIKNELINGDPERTSGFYSFDELTKLVNPVESYLFFFTRNMWTNDEARDAIRNTLGEIAQTIADQTGLLVEVSRYPSYSFRVRWEHEKKKIKEDEQA